MRVWGGVCVRVRVGECMCLHAQFLTCVLLCLTPWTVARQTPLSMEFSRQEYWSRLPFPTPRDLPDPRIECSLLHLLHWQADCLPLCPLGRHEMSSIQ